MRVVFEGEPIPACRVRVTRFGTYTPEKYRDYKRALSSFLFGRGYFDGPCRLSIEVYRSNKRRVDVDNLAKSVMDALQDSGVLKDDSLIDELSVRKFVDKDRPRIEFCLETI